MPEPGAQQHQLLHSIDATQLRRQRALKHRRRRMAVGLGPRRRLIRALGSTLDQPQLADVPRQRRLRDVEAGPRMRRRSCS